MQTTQHKSAARFLAEVLVVGYMGVGNPSVTRARTANDG